MSAAEHKTVIGVCESVEEKGDWRKYAIRVEGQQYPLKLSTKKPELIALAKAVGGQTARWGYLESQGGENPNRPGTFYVNRYLDSAEVTEGPKPARFDAIPDERRQELIVRQSCLKAAVDLLIGCNVPDKIWTSSEVAAVADLFVEWVWQEPQAAWDEDVPFE